MRWEDARRSDNIEDRRGDDSGGFGGGGGSFGGIGAGHLGLGTVVILGIISYALGIDPRVLIGGAEMVRWGGGCCLRSSPHWGRFSFLASAVAAEDGAADAADHDDPEGALEKSRERGAVVDILESLGDEV